MLDSVRSLVTHLSDEELVGLGRILRWTTFVVCLLAVVLTTYWVDSVTSLIDVLTQTVNVQWSMLVVQGAFCNAVWTAMLCTLSYFSSKTNDVWTSMQTERHRRTNLATEDPIRSSDELPLMVRLTSAMGPPNVKRKPMPTTGAFFG